MKAAFHYPKFNTVKQFNNVKETITYYMNKYQDYLLLFISK